MKINKIEIENFRLFSKKEFTFNPEFNLVIGVNGSGKTSLLKAIAVALGGWAYAYIKDEKNNCPILDKDIREIQIDNRFDKTNLTCIKASGKTLIINNYETKTNGIVTWERNRKEGYEDTHTEASIIYENDIGYSKEYSLNFNNLSQNILKFIEKGNKFNLPLIAFYECDRLWLAKNKLNIEATAQIQYSRFDPYIDCFYTGADHQAIGQWLLKHELASIQKKQETPVLQSIKKAAIGALENCSGFKFDFEQSRVIVEFKDETSTPFEHLSDGQRTILGLFCDIARRAAILNPHLGGNASAETSGVVLIDELDLHLHPKWQRRVTEDLRQTFPRIQFICTTHSPFLIQSLRSSEELIILDDDNKGTGETPYTKSIEEIVEIEMQVEDVQRSKRFLKMQKLASDYFDLIEQGRESKNDPETAEIKNQLDEIELEFSHDPVYVALMKAERRTR